MQLQLVLMLERGIIDKPMNFDVGLIQLSFHTSVFMYACKGVFNSNLPIFHSNCAEGLHFTDFFNISIFATHTQACRYTVCMNVST